MENMETGMIGLTKTVATDSNHGNVPIDLNRSTYNVSVN